MINVYWGITNIIINSSTFHYKHLGLFIYLFIVGLNKKKLTWIQRSNIIGGSWRLRTCWLAILSQHSKNNNKHNLQHNRDDAEFCASPIHRASSSKNTLNIAKSKFHSLKPKCLKWQRLPLARCLTFKCKVTSNVNAFFGCES